MSGTVNRVILVGNLGKAPDVRTMQNGNKVASFSVATSESWKDKNTGEKQERTQWHNIVVFNPALVNLCESYMDKGSKVYLEGQLETRKWQDNNGQDKYTTEIVLRPYNGSIVLLNRIDNTKNQNNDTVSNQQPASNPFNNSPLDDLDDDIPF